MSLLPCHLATLRRQQSESGRLCQFRAAGEFFCPSDVEAQLRPLLRVPQPVRHPHPQPARPKEPIALRLLRSHRTLQLDAPGIGHRIGNWNGQNCAHLHFLTYSHDFTLARKCCQLATWVSGTGNGTPKPERDSETGKPKLRAAARPGAGSREPLLCGSHSRGREPARDRGRAVAGGGSRRACAPRAATAPPPLSASATTPRLAATIPDA